MMKVYVKRDAKEDLERFTRLVMDMKRDLQPCPGILPYHSFHITSSAGYLLRPFIAHSLYDRFHTHPFIESMEQLWIAFQILKAVAQLHSKGFVHRDLKAENVLVTSWNWIFITDIAFYKPPQLPSDNPADHSAFYAVGNRRRCYIAPERFYTKRSVEAEASAASDIFSVGCVIAETFLEGEALFSLEQLLSYKAGNYDPSSTIEKIAHPLARELVKDMIRLDPLERSSASEYLKKYEGKLFPQSFEYLYEMFAVALGTEKASADEKVKLIQERYKEILKVCVNVEDTQDLHFLTKGLIDHADDPAELIRAVGSNVHWSSCREIHISNDKPKKKKKERDEVFVQQTEAILKEAQELKKEITLKLASEPELPQLIHTPTESAPDSSDELQHFSYIKNHSAIALSNSTETFHEKPSNALILIISFLTSALRNTKTTTARQICLHMIHHLSQYLPDSHFLSRVLPYSLALISQTNPKSSTSASTRALAVHLIAENLSKVRSVPPSDATVFPEYIWKSLSMLHSDHELVVRLAYAQNIASLAETSKRFLEISMRKGSYDKELALLHGSVWRAIVGMANDSSSAIKIALLQDITKLGVFFGRDKVNGQILPLLITTLNDKDWNLRASFFEHMIGICIFVGRLSLQDFILPCIEQALYDPEPFVIEKALQNLTVLCQLELFDDKVIEELSSRVSPLLCYPSAWIRRAAIEFCIAIGDRLGPSKTHCHIIPRISPFLQHEVVLIDRKAFPHAVRPPLSNKVFNTLVCKSDLPSLTLNEEILVGAMRSYMQGILGTTKPPREDRSLTLYEFSRLDEEISCISVSVPFSSKYFAVQQSISSKQRDPVSKSSSTVSDLHNSKFSSMLSQLHLKLYGTPNLHLTASSKAPSLIAYSQLPEGIRKALRVPRRGLDLGQDKLDDAFLSKNSFFNPSPFPLEDHVDASHISWRPRGVLVSNLKEHTNAVNSISVSRDNKFVLSCSSDGTAKLWDAFRIQNSVNASSQLTFKSKSPILDGKVLDSAHSFVVGSELGDVSVCRVEHTESRDSARYIGCSLVQSQTVEGSIVCIENYVTSHSNMILYASSSGVVYGWDLRTPERPFSFKVPQGAGMVTKMCIGAEGNLLVIGTSRGSIVLRDLRFAVSVQQWVHSLKSPVTVLEILETVSISGSNSPLVLVGVEGSNSVEAFDLVSGECKNWFVAHNQAQRTSSTIPREVLTDPKKIHETLRHVPKHQVVAGASIPSISRVMGSDRISQGLKEVSKQLMSSFEDRARMTGALVCDKSYMITAGSDAVIRHWNFKDPAASYRISSPREDLLGNHLFYKTHSSNGTLVHEEVLSRDVGDTSDATLEEFYKRHGRIRGPVGALTHHRDLITGLKCLEFPQKILVRSSFIRLTNSFPLIAAVVSRHGCSIKLMQRVQYRRC